MTKVRVKKILDILDQEELLEGNYPEELKKLKDQLDLTDTRPDGYVEGKDLNKVFAILDSYSSNTRSPFKKLSADSQKYSNAKVLIRGLFSSTAEGLLKRNGYFWNSKDLESNEFCLLPDNPDWVLSRKLVDSSTFKADFENLSDSEKMKFLAKLHHSAVKEDARNLLEIIFPELKKLQNQPELEIFEKILSEISQLVTHWRKTREKTSETRLRIFGNLFYLKTVRGVNLPELQHNIKPMNKAFKKSLSQLYEPELFDSDFDGTPDSQDKFPTHPAYQRDNNNNKIPDELEETGRGPSNLYGLKEGEYRRRSNLGLYRLNNKVYLIVNIALRSNHDIAQKELPYFRDLWKKNIEAVYQKMVPKVLGPVTVIVDFNSMNENGITETVLIHERRWRYKNSAITHTQWPLDISLTQIAHEMAHHLLLEDRYQASIIYKECTNFSPGVVRIWDKPHLMNVRRPKLKLDPIDLAFPIDLVSKTEPIKGSTSMAIAEIHFQQGDFEQAENIYLSFYEKNKTTPEKYFENDFFWETHSQIVSLAAIKGYILSRIGRYEKTKDTFLISEIENRISWLEKVGALKHNISSEAQAAYLDAKILRGLLEKAKGNKEKALSSLKAAQNADPANKGDWATFKIADYTKTATKRFPLTLGFNGGMTFNQSSNPNLALRPPALFGFTEASVGIPFELGRYKFGIAANLKGFFSREVSGVPTLQISISEDLFGFNRFIPSLNFAAGPYLSSDPDGFSVKPYIEASIKIANIVKLFGGWLYAGGGAGFITGEKGFLLPFFTVGYEYKRSRYPSPSEIISKAVEE
jgi:tetratricopeptide (TPR) repeat protein